MANYKNCKTHQEYKNKRSKKYKYENRDNKYSNKKSYNKKYTKSLKKKVNKKQIQQNMRIPNQLQAYLIRTPELRHNFIEIGGILGGDNNITNMGFAHICCKANGDTKRPVYVYAYKDMYLLTNPKRRSLIFHMNRTDIIITAMCKIPLTKSDTGSYSVIVYQLVRKKYSLKPKQIFRIYKKFKDPFEINRLIGCEIPSENSIISTNLYNNICDAKNKDMIIPLVKPIEKCIDKCLAKHITYTHFKQARIVAKILKNNL